MSCRSKKHFLITIVHPKLRKVKKLIFYVRLQLLYKIYYYMIINNKYFNNQMSILHLTENSQKAAQHILWADFFKVKIFKLSISELETHNFCWWFPICDPKKTLSVKWKQHAKIKLLFSQIQYMFNVYLQKNTKTFTFSKHNVQHYCFFMNNIHLNAVSCICMITSNCPAAVYTMCRENRLICNLTNENYIID